MLTDSYQLDTLRQIAHGIAAQFGENCEVIIHDPNHLDRSIVHIENGQVSNRRQGDGPSHIVLDAIRRDPATLSDKLAYLTRTQDGRILKSSTVYLRDRDGKLSAILSINYDITDLLAVEGSLRSLLSTGPSRQSDAEPQQIPLNVNQLLDELIQQSIQLIGKPAAAMTKNEKIRAIRFLNESGAFLITKSGDRVTEVFGISKYTLYNYLDAGKSSD